MRKNLEVSVSNDFLIAFFTTLVVFILGITSMMSEGRFLLRAVRAFFFIIACVFSFASGNVLEQNVERGYPISAFKENTTYRMVAFAQIDNGRRGLVVLAEDEFGRKVIGITWQREVPPYFIRKGLALLPAKTSSATAM